MSKILFVSDGEGFKPREDAISALKENGHEVHVVVVRSQQQAASCYEGAKGADCIVLSNLARLHAYDDAPDAQTMDGFVGTLQQSGKPMVVFDVLDKEQKEQLRTKYKIDSVNINPDAKDPIGKLNEKINFLTKNKRGQNSGTVMIS